MWDNQPGFVGPESMVALGDVWRGRQVDLNVLAERVDIIASPDLIEEGLQVRDGDFTSTEGGEWGNIVQPV